MGKAPIKSLQVDSMDADLKTGLWNVYLSCFVRKIERYRSYGSSDLDKYLDNLWQEHFKYPLEKRDPDYDQTFEIIQKLYSTYTYLEVYNFIEFHTDWNYRILSSLNVFPFIDECNRVLEREYSGFRVIDKHIVPISNQIEIAEINSAANVGVSLFGAKYKGVNIHLQEAIRKLSDKVQPDYRNSIKEAISAVESICRQLTNENTLGEALKALEKSGVTINPQLKTGFEKFYAYSNNKETGIRHAIVDDPEIPDFDDAKYMLVICSAFINLLIAKSK